MRVLVTGGAGFIGSHLSERLLAEGHEVVGFDDFDPLYPRAVKERNLSVAMDHGGFRFLEGDICRASDLQRIPEVDAVVHLAAQVGVRASLREPVRYAETNVVGTAALLEWSRERGVRTWAFASSSSVYGDRAGGAFSESDTVDAPVSPYAATKRAGELLCRTASELWGLRVACLRLFSVIGPRQRPDLALHMFASRLLAGESIRVFGDGTSSRDYTYVGDIVTGILAALDRAEHIEDAAAINLGNSRPVALRTMIDTLASMLDVPVREEHVGVQPGDVRHTHADIRKAGELLGYRPTTEFEEGVRSFVDWYLEGGAAGG